MAGFFKKLFGGGGGNSKSGGVEDLVRDTIEGILDTSGLDLDYDLNSSVDGEFTTIAVELSGPDEEIIKDKKAQVLDALQLLVKRIVQHNFPEDKTNISVDCGGYREETENALIERAETLKGLALEQGKSVYYRALPPKERKIVHQYLAKDPRIKSRSLGDGHYKKIKIYPVKNGNGATVEDSVQEST